MTKSIDGIKSIVYIIFNQLTSLVDYTMRLFQESYTQIKLGEATVENYLYACIIGFAILLLPVVGSQRRWVAVVSLLSCLIFSFQENFKTFLDRISENDIPVLRSTSVMINKLQPAYMLVISIVAAVIISYLFNKLMYFIVLGVYVTVILLVSMKYKDVIKNKSLELTGVVKTPIDVLYHPLTLICILSICFYLFHGVFISFLFAAIGTLMLALLVECIVEPKNQSTRLFFLDLKDGNPLDNNVLITWGVVTVLFVLAQYSIYCKIYQRLFKKEPRLRTLNEFIGTPVYINPGHK